MNKFGYLQAREFIYRDIQREINLTKISDTKKGKENLEKLIGFSGGANFMAALALLCYTEFAGLVKYEKKKINGEPHSSANFNFFFDDLGDEYKRFRKKHNVYKIFRCGLAHGYFIKHSYSCIAMQVDKATCGVGIDASGQYYFCVEKYFEDFQRAFDALGSKFIKGDLSGLVGGATTASVQRY